MKVAVLADMLQATPPLEYGGTQRMCSSLTEELIHRGHEVTLFATGDSSTKGRLVICTPRALHLSERHDYERSIMIQMGIFLQNFDEFDIVHSHIDYFGFPFVRLLPIPMVSTIHRRIDTPDMQEVYGQFRDVPLVSVSKSQRNYYPNANWQSTIYNGLPLDNLHICKKKENYFAFLGRICPEKGPVEAIRIARRTGIPLKIAARIDKGDMDYYNNVVKKMLDPGIVEFLGEISDHEKMQFLGPAKALLFPINWPEPFGLVMIEAMACGTPVLATRRGAVPEVVIDGQTGVIGDTIEDLVAGVDRLSRIDPNTCREHVEHHFTIEKMADAYESLFCKMIDTKLDVRA